jgi:hypothetical protein
MFVVHAAGNYTDVYAREHISPCQVLDDYNPDNYILVSALCS